MQRNARKLDQTKGHFLFFSRLPPIKKKSQFLSGRPADQKKNRGAGSTRSPAIKKIE
jgi:hypothetical protein